LAFTDSRGKTIHVNFPDSFLPIRITDTVPHDVLLESADLWAYINHGLLRPIAAKKAQMILATDDAKEERERLTTRSKGIRESDGDKMRREGGVMPSGQTRFDSQHPDDRGGKPVEDDRPPVVQNRVMAICGRVEAGQLKPRAAIAEFKNLRLTQEDLGYIMGNARCQGENLDGRTLFDNSVIDWASDTLVGRAQAKSAKKGCVDPTLAVDAMLNKQTKIKGTGRTQKG